MTKVFFDKLKEEGGGCRSEGLLRLVNRKGAGFRFLITAVGLFQKSLCTCRIPPFYNICDCRSQELLRKKSHEMPKGRGGMMKCLTLVS
jgi:hypothetical protein